MMRMAQEALEHAEKEEERELTDTRREGPMQLKGHTLGFWHTRWCSLKEGQLRWYMEQRHCTESRKERGMIEVTQLRRITMEKDVTEGLYFHLTAHDGVTYSFYAEQLETGKMWLEDIKRSIACEQETRRVEMEAEEKQRETARQARIVAGRSPSQSPAPVPVDDEEHQVEIAAASDFCNWWCVLIQALLLVLLLLVWSFAASATVPLWRTEGDEQGGHAGNQDL